FVQLQLTFQGKCLLCLSRGLHLQELIAKGPSEDSTFVTCTHHNEPRLNLQKWYCSAGYIGNTCSNEFQNTSVVTADGGSYNRGKRIVHLVYEPDSRCRFTNSDARNAMQ